MKVVRKLAAPVLCLGLTQCLGAPEAPPKLAGGKDDADVSGPADRGAHGDGATHDLGQPRDGSLRDQGGRQDARPATDGSSSDAHLDGLVSIDARVSMDGKSVDATGADARPIDGTVPDARVAPDAGPVDASPDALQPDAAGGGVCVPDAVERCGSNTGECMFGERTCTAARIWGACEGDVRPTDEVCNGLDDDCDGATDENLTQPCGVGGGPCEFGIQRCVGGEWGVCDDSAGPQPEVCDGIDNDCDGATDEDYQPVVECGVGACALDAVPSVCEGGVVVPCQPGPAAPDDTTCDGVDDDCDGAIDEDYVVVAACGIGACRARSVASNCAEGREAVCAPGAPLAAGDSSCDGIDDDCDGQFDEDYQPVQQCGVGVCRASSQPSACTGGVESPCQPGLAEAVDATCDGVDGDCDGVTDESYVVVPACGLGVCRTGATASSCANGTEHPCTPGSPRGATDATCDGVDDDCDGQVDEDYQPVLRCGVGACAAASRPSACVAGQETSCRPGPPAAGDATCDGVDDDCDGQTDENYNVVADCGVGECRAGATPSSCVAGRETICAPAPAQAETCDGLDNDCDGALDDGNPGGNQACDTGQLGVCTAGTSVCVQGHLRCDPDLAASDETCDGLDNDCDGLSDEAAAGGALTRACYDGPPGTMSVGPCQGGTQTCGAGRFGACVGEMTPVAESCDQRDNDCDGRVDNLAGGGSCACQPGQQRACYSGAAGTSGLGVCHGGTQTCAGDGSAWGACVGEVIPSVEQCNAVDDNCNGTVDDVAGVGIQCAVGTGECLRAGTLVCSLATGQLVCNAVPGQPIAETCDGRDNDCDGVNDNGSPGSGVACNTGLLGPCAAGRTTCQNGAITCLQHQQPAAEVCDNLDNDCDGATDEGNPGGGAACGTGLSGICAPGTQTCVDGALACVQNAPPVAEACDSLDNDCDGASDDGDPGGGVACDTGLAAGCEAGRTSCIAGGLLCEAEQTCAETAILRPATSGDGAPDDRFGSRVALSGDTAVVTVPYDDGPQASNRGSAYVYVRGPEGWTLQQKIISSEPTNERFGSSVALSGETIVLGAENWSGLGRSGQGAAYVFTRSNGRWAQQARLIANDGQTNNSFGRSVSIDGDTIVVGAQGASSNRGAVYVFRRTDGNWSLQVRLNATDGVAGDSLGQSVSISGTTILAGAPNNDGVASNQGAAYAFVAAANGTWSQQAKLTAADGAQNDILGASVALQGDVALVGAPQDDGSRGSVYAFARVGNMWSERQHFSALEAQAGDRFGGAISLSGGGTLIGSPFADGGDRAGAAYAFALVGGAWTQQARLAAGDRAPESWFGDSVALSGTTALVGAPYADFPSRADQGAAYVFEDGAAGWAQQTKLDSGEGAANDRLGESVDIDGDVAVLGAPQDALGDLAAAGSVQIFRRSARFWLIEQVLRRDVGAEAGDHFGASVSVSGQVLIVGAPGEDVLAGNQGAAHVFTFSNGRWSETALLVAPDAVGGDAFGYSVALAGDTAFVSAPNKTVDGYGNRGAVYAFANRGGAWQYEQTLLGPSGVGQLFGRGLSAGPDVVAVGAPGIGGGRVYIFGRVGGRWSLVQELGPANNFGIVAFGASLRLSLPNMAELVVGAPESNGGGAAFVFLRDQGGQWLESQKLTAAPSAGGLFGTSVASGGGIVAVGAPDATWSGAVRAGAVFVFEAVNGVYAQRLQFGSSESRAYDAFGSAIALEGRTLVSTSPDTEGDALFGNSSEGAAYVTELRCLVPCH